VCGEVNQTVTEPRIEDVISFLPDATFAIDTNGTVIFWNRAAEEMTGVAAADMIGRGDHEYALPFYGERRPILIDLALTPNELVERDYDRLMNRGKNFISVETMLPKLGRYVFGTASVIYDGDGNVIGAIESVRDITDRKRAEDTLADYRKHLEDMVETRTAELNQANRDLAERNEQLSKLNNLLYVAATTDPLTGLQNRRRIIETLKEEAARFKRNRRPFSLVLTDIDYFKSVNDRFGHECGDLVLKHVSGLLRKSVREYDQVARWGGEEFLMVLPETTIDAATVMAERLRQSVEESTAQWQQREIDVTITLGVAEHRRPNDVDGTIREADDALYRGKERGRNCVVASA
jgi:diguanylate cyclase (GGDEF)-like protein/PAS domain S-box-containing protein